MKSITGIYQTKHQHWVGDGFPVRSLFSYDTFGQSLSPFLLLDYAGPMHFTPTEHARGVGSHPHRGFETVTIVYQGEVAHRDSTGSGGVIQAGDVQWMTAGSGIVHEEFHSPEFSQSGGELEMVQLWVNLPAKDKMTAPRYQGITRAEIPVLTLPDQAGQLRVIAGQYQDGTQEIAGAAQTFSPINVWDVQLNASHTVQMQVPEGHSLALVILKGSVEVNQQKSAQQAQLVVLSQAGREFSLTAQQDSTLLVLSGEPLNEPIEGYGPFVMNTKQQITQAIHDFNNGTFGRI
ncbi:MAG: pirin family protein [Pseudomonadota bacterium]|nr:pirin family protein [Pseudomonadota bacterium]